MGGPGSGRRAMRYEVRKHETVKKAWEHCEQMLLDKNYKLTEKQYELSKGLVLRTAPQHIKGEGFETNVFFNAIQQVIENARRTTNRVADTTESSDTGAGSLEIESDITG